MAEVELRIQALAAGGDGVGRAPDGRVCFVPFTAPGDRVRVELERSHPRYARGRVIRIIEPGADRVEPACPVFGECGGCAWQHVSYAAQLEAKRGIVRDALRRIGRLDWSGPLAIAPSPAAYGYRGRVRVWVEAGRVGYRQRRSHALCAVVRCPVLVPELEARLAELAEAPPRVDGEWELASGGGRTRAVALARQPRRAAGAGPRLELRVGVDRLAVSPGVFIQSNALLLETLVERVAHHAGSGALLVELYAGAGLLTLGVARRFARVVAVESDPAAAADLEANRLAAGLHHVEVRSLRVEQALKALEDLAPDALLLDPPRAGLPADVAAALAGAEPRRIGYLSCDPATLARDLAVLVAGGHRLRHVEAFDLFPQTPHVEVLAVLERV